MENRTTAVIITVLTVFICICPGLAALCLGLASALDYAAGFGIFATDQRSYLALIFGGACAGVFLIVLAGVIIYLVLRQPKPRSTPPPPSISSPPPSPPPPEEPIPPTI